MRFLVLLCFCHMIYPAASNAQTRLTPELLWTIGRVSLDAVSPSGTWAVYGVQRFDAATDKNTRTLYLVRIADGQTRQLTEPSLSASDAAFHPSEDRVGFLSAGKMHEISLSGSEVRMVSEMEINGFHYAPNGMYVVFAKDVKLDPATAEIHPDLPRATGRAFDGMMYRHWKTWRQQHYSNVFYTAYRDGRFVGEPVNIQNERYDSPLTPQGGMEQIAWSPDSRFIAYTCRKLHGTQEAVSTNSDIYLYELATGKTQNLTADNPGFDIDPVFSPDGAFLAWTRMTTAGYEADRTRLMVREKATGKIRELTSNWAYEANHPQWSADGKSLYFLSSENFTYQLYEVGLENARIRKITEGAHDFNAFKVAGNVLAAVRTSMTAPAEVYAVTASDGQMRRLSYATAKPWDEFAPCKVERRTVTTFDGKPMNVWLVLPPDFDPAKKYPALVYCQGGPQSALSQYFSYRWNFSLMASQGYVVVLPCRRGMPGSGYLWNDAITGAWGDAMKDYLSATDAIRKEAFIDGSRLAAVGASFGGYAVYWLAGNHEKRFKTFISHCGLFNLESFYGTTEEVWFPHHDFEGAYWQNPKPKMYVNDSPHLYVQNWDTPILVIHNELDFRVPFSEGMQAFHAAQLRNIPSRFLSFPDEGHWMSKPQNSLLWQREFFGWLAKYL